MDGVPDGPEHEFLELLEISGVADGVALVSEAISMCTCIIPNNSPRHHTYVRSCQSAPVSICLGVYK